MRNEAMEWDVLRDGRERELLVTGPLSFLRNVSHGVISKKTTSLIVTAVKTSDLT
jgi:hypothetical protein